MDMEVDGEVEAIGESRRGESEVFASSVIGEGEIASSVGPQEGELDSPVEPAIRYEEVEASMTGEALPLDEQASRMEQD